MSCDCGFVWLSYPFIMPLLCFIRFACFRFFVVRISWRFLPLKFHFSAPLDVCVQIDRMIDQDSASNTTNIMDMLPPDNWLKTRVERYSQLAKSLFHDYVQCWNCCCRLMIQDNLSSLAQAMAFKREYSFYRRLACRFFPKPEWFFWRFDCFLVTKWAPIFD